MRIQQRFNGNQLRFHTTEFQYRRVMSSSPINSNYLIESAQTKEEWTSYSLTD